MIWLVVLRNPAAVAGEGDLHYAQVEADTEAAARTAATDRMGDDGFTVIESAENLPDAARAAEG